MTESFSVNTTPVVSPGFDRVSNIHDRVHASTAELLEKGVPGLIERERMQRWFCDANVGDIDTYYGHPCRVVEWGSNRYLMLSRALEKTENNLQTHTISHCVERISDLMGIPGLQVMDIGLFEGLRIAHMIHPESGRIYISSSRDKPDGYWAYCPRQHHIYSCYAPNRLSFNYDQHSAQHRGDVYAFLCYIDLDMSAIQTADVC